MPFLQQVRIGTTLRRPSGKLEKETLYKKTYKMTSSMTDLRLKPTWYTDLTTPYGEFAEGRARGLGEPHGTPIPTVA